MNYIKTTVSVFDKCAAEYQDKFMDVSGYHKGLDLFCNSITKNDAHILEIACGPGNITRYILQQRPGFKITGTDMSPNMINLARSNNPTADFQVIDCRDIETMNEQYDAVMCGFCLPYLTETEVMKLISDTMKLLCPGGVFYISTMEVNEHCQSGIKKTTSGDEIYVNYHRAEYLTQVLTANGFHITALQRQDYAAANEEITSDLIIIAKL